VEQVGEFVDRGVDVGWDAHAKRLKNCSHVKRIDGAGARNIVWGVANG
jgi:methyl coenzyme M reductase gamma subunit